MRKQRSLSLGKKAMNFAVINCENNEDNQIIVNYTQKSPILRIFLQTYILTTQTSP